MKELSTVQTSETKGDACRGLKSLDPNSRARPPSLGDCD